VGMLSQKPIESNLFF